jgi:hypothetical protein
LQQEHGSMITSFILEINAVPLNHIARVYPYPSARLSSVMNFEQSVDFYGTWCEGHAVWDEFLIPYKKEHHHIFS